jgi:sensor histidine kinase YesM
MHLSDRKGVIRISFRREEDALYCTIEDNGVGRDESALINANKRANHKSAGIEITIARLKLLHQELKSRYFYRISDKTDSNGRFDGTLVEFTIPYKINSTNDPHHNS